MFKAEIGDTNKRLQTSGNQLVQKSDLLIKKQKILRNIDVAIEILTICLPGESWAIVLYASSQLKQDFCATMNLLFCSDDVLLLITVLDAYKKLNEQMAVKR